MFMQVIRGEVADAARLKSRHEGWNAELRPGATGFVGAVGGVTPAGVGIAVACFESADAARRNSDRPEQGAWWAETQACFAGDVTFEDYDGVETLGGGLVRDAGFVQVMRGRVTDVDKARQVNDRAEDVLREHRPDVIGGLSGLNADGRFADVIFFTSEKEAREGESREMPAELQSMMEEWGALYVDIAYDDLVEPWTM